MIAFLREFGAFLRTRKRLWLLPIFIMVLLFGGLAMIGNASAIAPFLYALF